MAQITRVIQKLQLEPEALLPSRQRVDALCEGLGHQWRDRLFTPLVTLRLFLLQVLHQNTAINNLRHFVGFSFAAGSYGDARKRLPLALIEGLFAWLLKKAQAVGGQTRLLGQRILMVDGSSFSTPDTPELLKHFGLYAGKGVKEGVSYPLAKIVGLLDAGTGMFLSMLNVPLYQHDLRGMIGLHPELRASDILLADRAFSSYAHIALLGLKGVFACMRLHQRRKTKGRGIERWSKPENRPVWISVEQYATLPDVLQVRLVRYAVKDKGFRTKHVTVVTTLVDERLWPDDRLAALYGIRWQIEMCLDHLKTTMGMCVLKCKTVEGVKKEMAMYLLAYNLVRLVMLTAARRQGVSANRISFIDALRWLASIALGYGGGVETLVVNPERPGRSAPRVRRRRPKQYALMTKPREEYETTVHVHRKA